MKGIGTVRLWASSTILVREIFAKITATVEISHRITLRTYIDCSRVRSYKFHSIFHDLESWLDCLAAIATKALQVVLTELSFAHFSVAFEGAALCSFISLISTICWHPFPLLDMETGA